MRLIDAIINVARPVDESRWAYSAPEEAIYESLGLTYSYDSNEEIDKALKAYPIFNWICTDEHVGLDAIYLNDAPMGCCYRSARKNHYEIEWISNEHAAKVRDFLLSFTPPRTFNLMDPDQDIGEDFTVQFTTQALTDDGFYEGRPVKALIWYDGLMGRTTPPQYRTKGKAYVEAVDYKDPKSNCVLVQDGDEERVIPIDQFRIPFNLAKGD